MQAREVAVQRASAGPGGGGPTTSAVELPGVDEKDVELSIDGSTLIVKGEKHATARAENEGVLHAERTHGAFQRALELPVEIDANAVQARLEHGLLVISLPKSEKAKPRKIEVSTDAESPVIRAHESADAPQPVEQ